MPRADPHDLARIMLAAAVPGLDAHLQLVRRPAIGVAAAAERRYEARLTRVSLAVVVCV